MTDYPTGGRGSRVVVPAGVAGRTKAERVRAMFADIVPRYDRMNQVMTLGMDAGWRRAAATMAQPVNALALDVGTGTADLAVSLLDAGARAVVGVDYVTRMLDVAREKLVSKQLGARISLVCGDAMLLPFADQSFDCVANAFLLRNVSDIPSTLRELVRVVKPGGRIVCLEISHGVWYIRPLFALYFGGLIPILGAILTGKFHAYRYLPASLGPLPDVDRLGFIMREAGLHDVSYRRYGFGTVAVHVGTR